MKIVPADRKILRALAKRVAEIADDAAMERRRRMWFEHNALRSAYPLMLVFPEGSWEELLPRLFCTCSGEKARSLEWGLRAKIYGYEHFQDDMVVEKEWIVGKRIRSDSTSGRKSAGKSYGDVRERRRPSDQKLLC